MTSRYQITISVDTGQPSFQLHVDTMVRAVSHETRTAISSAEPNIGSHAFTPTIRDTVTEFEQYATEISRFTVRHQRFHEHNKAIS